ncbi:Glycerophosphoinositol inositolphosphodiesterase GDPD2, partial [Eschrichtius robustus]|nr:Glycerophosphoinositol inositolphosphodiesterase GDPD2 [Eschrichtius robustus]
PKILLLLLFFGVALAIYLVPLFISSACIMEPKDLPPKPELTGHRGAPMLAPENTLMSLRKTAECGAVVFETDVMVRALHQDNVSVNLFVVNKPWLFSLLWCAGVDSVTTNDCQLLQQMRYPVWLIPPQTYLMMWIITNCVSILLLLWTFLLQRRCAKERERTGLETAVLLTRINAFIME